MQKAVFLLVATIAVVYGHVQGVFDANNAAIAYRNAPSPTENSAFSVAGPCGGQQQFGKNGILQVSAGTATTLALHYNGGHASPANAFRLTIMCSPTQPASDTTLRGTTNAIQTCAGGAKGGAQTTTCPVPVTDQNQVYTLSFTWANTITLGTGSLTIADKDYCTVSIIDQNQWGSCVDFQYNIAQVQPPTNPGTNLNLVVDQSGAYTAADTGATCDTSQDGAKCCCMHGTLNLAHNLQMGATYNTGTISGQLYFAVNQTNLCVPANFTLPGGRMDTSMSWPVAGKSGQLSVLTGQGTVQMLGEILQVDANNGKIKVTNMSPGSPRICSNTFYAAGSIAAMFAQQSSALTTTNSTAAAVMIPIVIFAIAGLIFFLRTPIQNCLGNSSGDAARFKWVAFVLNFFVLVLVMAAVVSNHWSKNDTAFVGPWKACTADMDCLDTLDALSSGTGNVYAVRFFMVTAVFPAFAMLAMPFLAKFGFLGEIKAAAATWYCLLYIGVAAFISMCVWAAFQYDTLAHYTGAGDWSPDWALGLSVLVWLVAFCSAIVTYVWKMKASGNGGDLAAAKNKAINTTPQQTSAPATAAVTYPTPAPQASYPTPQPLNTTQQYGEQPQQYYDQNQYGQQQQYGQPGVDV